MFRHKGPALASATAFALFFTPLSAENGTGGVVRAFDEAMFVSVDPARPDFAAIAVLKGDPETGPSDMLLRMAEGESAMHVHTSDYRLALISGHMRHWFNESEKENAAVLGPGSYWFQPGGEPHGGECLSDECLMFVSWSGPRDARLAE